MTRAYTPEELELMKRGDEIRDDIERVEQIARKMVAGLREQLIVLAMREQLIVLARRGAAISAQADAVAQGQEVHAFYERYLKKDAEPMVKQWAPAVDAMGRALDTYPTIQEAIDFAAVEARVMMAAPPVGGCRCGICREYGVDGEHTVFSLAPNPTPTGRRITVDMETVKPRAVTGWENVEEFMRRALTAQPLFTATAAEVRAKHERPPGSIPFGDGYVVPRLGPAVCECGAAKTGIAPGAAGHSSWCPAK